MNNVICTIGTSLLGNLERLKAQTVEEALANKDVNFIVSYLAEQDARDKLCGAEINSIKEMLVNGYITKGNMHLLYSDTEKGQFVADILAQYYKELGWSVYLVRIVGLQDDEPKVFKTTGLRNLIKESAKILRSYGTEYSTINATGGYKAQIAVAVMLGQALSIPIYYKHDLFNEIITFPPMPFSLDFALWLEYNHLFELLSNYNEVPEHEVQIDTWDEKLEALIEREDLYGEKHIALTVAGQIFHETLRVKQIKREDLLPPVVPKELKKAVKLSDHNWPDRGQVIKVIEDLLEVSFVEDCKTHYLNPNCSSKSYFKLTNNEIEGILSNGAWTVKFNVYTRATTKEQKLAAIEYLNRKREEIF